jgi:hypothetical protein
LWTAGLGIAFKGPEGIVLAADSRVTLTAQIQIPGLGGVMTIPATFDNARKLLQVNGQPYIGVVTYGAGALGTTEPRTAHSFLPDFETELRGEDRLTVGDFAQRLSDFFLDKWNALMPAAVPAGNDMIFYVAGFDEDEPYGRVYEVQIPARPVPNELSVGGFGIVWGGQREVVDRILQGFDERVPTTAQQQLTLTDAQTQALRDQLRQTLNLQIPYQFLPLQDCVDLATLLVHTTAQLQTWVLGVRGVGGPVDVATITRTEGFKEVQIKKIQGTEGRGD